MKIIIALLLVVSSAFAETITLSSRNTLSLNSEVDSASVSELQVKLMKMSTTLKPGEPIYLVLYTPGGSISAGSMLIETIKTLPNPVHTITIFAASMGYQIVQNAGNRYILSSGTLMSHLGSISGLSGQIGGNLDSLVTYLKHMTDQMDEIAAKRVGISLQRYQEIISKEYWGYGNEAVKNGHADSVVSVRCDNTLSGTHKQLVNFFFFKANVTFSNCPLIVNPLSISADNKKNEDEVYTYYKTINKKVVYKW